MNTHAHFSLQFASEDETAAFGKKLAGAVRGGVVLYLAGQLGAGKTTLVRGVLRGMGYQGKVKSPTFTLVEPYNISGVSLYHFDFYRLNDPEELAHIGIREYFEPGSVCLIEWPEKGGMFLPAADVICQITIDRQVRRLEIESRTARGDEILKLL